RHALAAARRRPLEVGLVALPDARKGPDRLGLVRPHPPRSRLRRRALHRARGPGVRGERGGREGGPPPRPRAPRPVRLIHTGVLASAAGALYFLSTCANVCAGSCRSISCALFSVRRTSPSARSTTAPPRPAPRTGRATSTTWPASASRWSSTGSSGAGITPRRTGSTGTTWTG